MSKRIRFRLFGKQISVSKDEWDQLKQRFDEKNAVLVTHTGSPEYFYEINIACFWCVKTSPGFCGCENCMWHKFKRIETSLAKNLREQVVAVCRYHWSDAPGCMVALARVLEDKYGVGSYFGKSFALGGGALIISDRRIRWTIGVDVEARKILWCIQNELKIIEARRKK